MKFDSNGNKRSPFYVEPIWSWEYTNQKANPLNSKMANADTLDGAGVNSGNALDAAKIKENFELSKLLGEKLLEEGLLPKRRTKKAAVHPESSSSLPNLLFQAQPFNYSILYSIYRVNLKSKNKVSVRRSIKISLRY